LVDRVRRALPYSFRERINRVLPFETQATLVSRVLAGSGDWSHTRAYCEDVTRENQPWIRLTARGRGPFGLVEAGKQYNDLCEVDSREVMSLRTWPGGTPAARAVVRSQEAYAGGHADQLPDLIVEWTPRTEISTVEHPRLGKIVGDVPTLRVSTHSDRA